MHGNNTGKSQVRDQLQGKDFATIDASLIGTAGGRVFLNPKTGNDQTAVITIAETFRGVHLPSLGQFIPQSGEFVTVTVADTRNGLVTPTDNQVFRIDSISVSNTGIPDLTATVKLTDSVAEPTSNVTLAKQVIAGGDTTAVISLTNPIYIDKNAILTVEASGSSLAFTAFVYKVVQ